MNCGLGNRFKQLGECSYCVVFVDVRIVGNQFKIIKCDKNQSKIQSRFLGIPGAPFGGLWGSFGAPWGSLGVVWGVFRDPLGIPGVPFGRLWGCLGSALRILGIPGGSLGTPGLIFGFFLEIMGPLLAPFWHPFGTFFRLSGSVAFFIDF